MHKEIKDDIELAVKQKMQALTDLQHKVKELELLPSQVEFQIKTGLNEFRDKIHMLQDTVRGHTSRFVFVDDKFGEVYENLGSKEKEIIKIKDKLLKNDVLVKTEFVKYDLRLATMDDRLAKLDKTYQMVMVHETSKAEQSDLEKLAFKLENDAPDMTNFNKQKEKMYSYIKSNDEAIANIWAQCTKI